MILTLGTDLQIISDKIAIEPEIFNLSPNTQEFDVVTLELDDCGKLIDPAPLDEIVSHIETCRRKNVNGVVVTLFAHGWHHGKDWDDSHFQSFRKLLASLCVREAERYDPDLRGRRVIGVYLAWNGDPDDSWLTKIPYLTHLSFWNRYNTANKAGTGQDLYRIVQELIKAAKLPIVNELSNADNITECPLILTGHSMGAILVELVFLSLLKANEAAIIDKHSRLDDEIVEIKRGPDKIMAPDVVLALNSAADSEIACEIKKLLEQQEWQKVAEDSNGKIRYNPPVMLSVTSASDLDTGRIWRFAKPFRKTDGHSAELFTHTFDALYPEICSPRGPIDFGQVWHCIRQPQPPIGKSPNIFIDLPLGTRQEDGSLEHMRYELRCLNPDKEELAWIFQIPGDLCKDHNDIFNPQMGSLVLALIQISGAVMSLANEWAQSFEV